MANSIQKLNEDWCREYISEYVFKLRPEEYQNQHPIWPGSVGLEVEMLPVIAQSDGLPPKLVPLQGHSNTLASCLKRLSLKNNWHFYEQPGPKGDGDLLIKVAMERGDALTFEPGGQLEFSSVPYPCLGDAVKRLHTVQGELKKSFGECGISLLQIGQNPFYGVDEVGLQMPKERYQAMDQHFSNIGPWGQRMMRLTCTLQVCLDFGPHETIMAQRYILGQLLAPFATAIFANSPFFQGNLTESLSFRSLAWRELDPSRTGLPKGLELILCQLNKASCVDVYTEMVLDSQVIFVEALGYKIPVKPFTFRQWLSESIEGINPTVKDFETQLSLMFPEVRPRNFLEIRSIDCQSQVWQVAPAAFCTGILYDDQNLIEAIDLLAPELPRLDSLLVKAANGLRDEVVRGYAQRLMEMAIEGFSRLPSCFLLEGSLRNIENFNKIFTSQGRTPGDDLKEAYQKRSNNQSLYEVICSVDRRWQELDV